MRKKLYFFCLQIFDRLRSESPNMFKKVFAINTNFDCHDLDISDENKSSIYKETQVGLIFIYFIVKWCMVESFFKQIHFLKRVVVIQVY